jgi:hypothetical protein
MTYTTSADCKTIMTAEDVAGMLSMPVEAVQRMTQARAQAGSNPIPFFKVNGRLRFWRHEIMAWRKRFSEQQNAVRTLKAALPKGNNRKTAVV